MSFQVVWIEDPGLGFAPAKATTMSVTIRLRHPDMSRSEGDTSPYRNSSRELLFRIVHVVSVYVVCSVTPSVDTSSVGIPRFCVSQARECSGLVPILGTDEVLSSSWTPSLLC
ncbi:hypothetical protein Taro_035219 [Colocasia esculenta]|uniref:Uncharacterized protein n=1 Tax=Colocasia esculenta TaxID=4460 RepID=A0A843W9W0_COLES|nr:hypothetical protein [Colocasia esculenta]